MKRIVSNCIFPTLIASVLMFIGAPLPVHADHDNELKRCLENAENNHQRSECFWSRRKHAGR